MTINYLLNVNTNWLVHFARTASNAYRETDLKNKWYDCFTSFGVVGELFLVVAVFAESPYCHLVETDRGEQTSWKNDNVFLKHQIPIS